MTSGHYEHMVMPYRLINAPSVFQIFINNVLRDMLRKSMFAYRDMLIYFKSLSQHI